MFQIRHLMWSLDRASYEWNETDYPPMTKDEAWETVTELTNDAIDQGEPDRWTIMPISPN